MVGLLPLNKINLLLVVHPHQVHLNRSVEWGNLDRALVSHLPRDPHDGKLRFYVTGVYTTRCRHDGDDDEKWRDFLPMLMEHPDVEVDRDLLNDPFRYNLGYGESGPGI